MADSMSSTRPFDDDGYLGYDPRLASQRFDSFSSFAENESVKEAAEDSPIFNSSSYVGAGDDVFTSQAVPETPSPTSIYGSGGGFASDQPDLSSFSPEANGKPYDPFAAPDEPILPPPADMEPEEGFALREWRRLCLHIEFSYSMVSQLDFSFVFLPDLWSARGNSVHGFDLS